MAKPKTLEEYEAAYAELEKKLGSQGDELGKLRTSLQEYDRWTKEAAPIVDWYVKNETEVKRRWDAADRPQQPTQPTQPTSGAVQQQAAAIAQQNPDYQFMTPQERQALVGEITQHLNQQVLGPWTQTFTKQVQDFAQQQIAQMQNQFRSNNDVMWRTLQRIFPEQMKNAAAWHQEALKYADPSKLDPMTMAQEALDREAALADLKSQVEKYQKQEQDREKLAAPSILCGAPPDAATQAAPRAASKDERFARVMETVKTEHGPEGAHALFGAQTSLG